MRVSVVVCEHTLDRYDDLREAAESVLGQTHDDVELVLVADGNNRVCVRLREDYGDRSGVLVHCNEENVGLLESRNTGAEAATGDVVAFLDDDAVADEGWVAELAAVYERRDVPAVGGRMTPAWVAGKPTILPAEFYWLVGVTHRGFAEGPGEVRNTFGSNISFRRDAFLELGGFDTEIGGRQGDANLQGRCCAVRRAGPPVRDALGPHRGCRARLSLRRREVVGGVTGAHAERLPDGGAFRRLPA